MSYRRPRGPDDWHPADIKAALEKRGYSLRRIAREHGYARVQDVLSRPWSQVQEIIARILGVSPETIWPSRYLGDAAPERRPAAKRQAEA